MTDLLYLFARKERVLYLPRVKELLHLVIESDRTRLSFNGA